MTTRRNQDTWRKPKGKGKAPAKVTHSKEPARAAQKLSTKKQNKNLEVHLDNLSDQDNYSQSESGSDSDGDKKPKAKTNQKGDIRKDGKDNRDGRKRHHSEYGDDDMIGAKHSNEYDNRDFADDQLDTVPNKKPRSEMSEQQRAGYVEQLKQEGVLQSGDSMRKVITEYVKTTLFRKLKFINCSSQMMHDSDVAQKVMKDYGVVEEEQYSWWSERKTFIFNAIRTRRNNTGSCIRSAFLRKYREKVPVYTLA